MITITESAQTHFQKLLKDQPEDTRIRVFVVSPGTLQAECGVSYCPGDSVEEDDLHFQFGSLGAVVDPQSAPFLEEAEIDFVSEGLSSQLTLKAPNAKVRKVSDDAPLFERINYVIQSTINPQLASHGGYVSLVDITEDKLAILNFGGGCNGCSMVDITLKEGVEKELLNQFGEELTGAKDVTEHQRGSHSYY